MLEKDVNAILNGEAFLIADEGNHFVFDPDNGVTNINVPLRFRNANGNTRPLLHGDNSFISISYEALRTNPWYKAEYHLTGYDYFIRYYDYESTSEEYAVQLAEILSSKAGKTISPDDVLMWCMETHAQGLYENNLLAE